MSEDARHRTKVWLDKYLDNTALTKDDDDTEVKFIVSYAKPSYSVETVFKTKEVDLTFSIDKPQSKPLIEIQGVPHAYVENVPIIVECVEKPGITPDKLLWKAELELRRVAEEHPEGSKRTIELMKDETKRTKGFTVYSCTYILRYRRAATVSGTPTLTYGHGKLEECQTAYVDRYDSADALTSPSCTVQHDSYFRIQGTTDNVAAVEYCYYRSANLTSEGVSTSTYDKWLLRFRTSVDGDGLGVKVEIVYTDLSTETLYGSTPEYSQTWKTVSGSITADKTLKYIRFYAAEDAADNTNGTYYVDYDFLLLHIGTFTFPYVSRPLGFDIENREAIHKIPGIVGIRTQYLGLDSPLITITGDMDTAGSWGIPDGQYLIWTTFNRHNEPWQWFTFGDYKFKAEIVSFKPKLSSEDDAKLQYVLTLRKHDEYSGSNDTYLEYFGIE